MAIYSEIFRQNPSSSFNELIQLLSLEQQETLIGDILKGLVEPIEVWLIRGKPAWLLASNSPADFAFDLLVRSDPQWLDRHSGYIEEVFQTSLSNRNNSGDKIMANIKLLVANARAGMGASFLRRQLGEGAYKDEREEVELYLLLAKLEETTIGFEPELWFKDLHVSPDEKAHLSAVRLYVFREIEPRNAINSLMVWDDSISPIAHSCPKWLQDMLMVYLRQAIYHQLSGKNWTAYDNYLDIKSRFKQPWLQDLFKTAENHPALADIIKQHKIYSDSGVPSTTPDSIKDIEIKRGLTDTRIPENIVHP